MHRDIPPTFDRVAVRRIFARAGDGDPEFAQVMLSARNMLLDCLDGIRIAPKRILDLGAGAGTAAGALARRFRAADVVSVDPVVGLLSRAKSRAPRWRSKQRYVAAEAERLPLPPHSVDLVFSSMAMPWFDPVEDALAESLRTLRPGGLFLLGTLGPETLKELSLSWSDGGNPGRMHPLVDMHMLGDALVRTGFVDVVMDVHRARFRVADFWRLCGILSRSGGSAALARRRRGLHAPATFRAAAERYESLRRPDGTLPVTVEFVFGHAWAPQQARHRSSGVSPRMDWSGGERFR